MLSALRYREPKTLYKGLRGALIWLQGRRPSWFNHAHWSIFSATESPKPLSAAVVRSAISHGIAPQNITRRDALGHADLMMCSSGRGYCL
jgi:hypothetical protein